MSDDEIGDMESDDTVAEGDQDVDWSQVDKLAAQIDTIDAVEYDDDRLEAAKAWAAELESETE